MHENAAKLETIINNILNEGFLINSDLLRFAETIWGIIDMKELSEHLSGQELFESGLSSLLFYPKEKTKNDIEAILRGNALDPALILSISESITAEKRKVPVTIQEMDQTIYLHLDKQLLNTLVKALHLEYTAPAVLSENVPENIRLISWISLRSRALSPDRAGESFLEQFIQRSSASRVFDDKKYLEMLNYLLDFLAVEKPETDIYSALSHRKKKLQKEQSKIGSFRKEFGRFSMDYIMTQRIQVPTANPESLAEEIYIIDRICFITCGGSAEGIMPENTNNIELEKIDDKTVEAVMRFLS